MVRSETLAERSGRSSVALHMVASADTLERRRAQLRRRRLRGAIREWAALIGVAVLGLWMAGIACLAVMAR